METFTRKQEVVASYLRKKEKADSEGPKPKLNEIYTRTQEIVNGLIHGGGILFGLAGLPVLTSIANVHGNTHAIIGGGIYGFCFLLAFAVSTIYHLVSEPKVKRIFKILDHIDIYYFISGTYTPFLLVYMHNPFGMTLLAILWGLTVLGTVFKVWYTGRFEVVSTL